MSEQQNPSPVKKRTKKGKKRLATQIVTLVALLVLLVGVVVVIVVMVNRDRSIIQPTPQETSANQTQSQGTDIDQVETTQAAVDVEGIIQEASVKAAMYDYDAAIAYVKEAVPDYESDSKVTQFIADCENNRAKLVKWPDNTQITHVFFHSLIMDCDLAFNSSSADNYNQVMTTIEEFNAIMETMYHKGYVLVSLYDIASINPETGQMEYNDIMLPEGKIPFVLSEDDVSYYEYMQGDGFPNRLIVTEDGKIMNEVDNADGTTTIGAFDVVPLLDQFVEEHPDFSYHGSKGILALTGYDGVLGYRTSYVDYADEETLARVMDDLTTVKNNDPGYLKNLIYETHYSFNNPNIEEDREKAKEVAAAIRADGWSFASHTWGHTRMSNVVDSSNGNITSNWFYTDTAWWNYEVESIVGDTDIIIFAFGADIYTWKPYTDDNQAYLYLKEQGFNYFCNVDSSQYYVQLDPTAGGSGFLRQGRRNLDGQLMYRAILYPEKGLLDDLFDVNRIFDTRRPTPVKGVELPATETATEAPAQ